MTRYPEPKSVKPTEIIRAIVYPVVTPAVLIPLVIFWLFIAFALWGGIFGVLLLLLVTPAVFRSQAVLLEARARDAEPETPDIGFFSWFGNAWSLFPAPVVIGAVLLVDLVRRQQGEAAAAVLAVVACIVLPVFVTVLAVTRSPLQGLNPVALTRLARRCWGRLWIASMYLLTALAGLGNAGELPVWLAVGMLLVVGYAFFSLVGSLVAPFGLVDDVYIPEPVEKSAAEISAGTLRERRKTLDHAYAFASRGNGEGGLRHIMAHVDREPDRIAAWGWFLDRMFCWENTGHALFFARHCLHDCLAQGDRVRAVKVLLRCRMEEERFLPLPDDIPAAIEAAEATGNHELAAVLKRG